MTPQQALQFLDQALSQISAPRQIHTQIAQAVGVLNAAIATQLKTVPSPQSKEPPKTEEKK